MSENVVAPPPRLHHNVIPPGAHQYAPREYRPPLSIIKFLELVMFASSVMALNTVRKSLAIACTTLHYYSFDDGDLVTGFLATGTFCGFIVILFTVMAGYLMKAHLHRRLSIFYSLLGCACFLTSGVFIIEAWEHAFRTRTRDLAITKGSIAVINGVIFLMDTIFTFRERK
uniref:MARVEL domain-containing protein n=1 Tax=Anopheles culicifacies TaxID=139723 RepID=A0A182MKX9_9DIPT